MFKVIYLIGLMTIVLSLYPAAATAATTDPTGKLESVRLSDDSSHVTISYSGSIGPYSAFVMTKPNRVVVDLEKLGSGKLPPKIAPAGDEIREIRVGNTNEKTRVVIDFGDNPLPKFTLVRQEESLVIRLHGTEAVHTQQPVRPRQMETSASFAAPARQRSSLSIKNATLNGNRLTVEVVGSNSDSYKLTVDIDPHTKQIKEGFFKGPAGSLKKLQLTGTDDREHFATKRSAPDRSVKNGTSGSPGKKFKWGLQSNSEQLSISR